MSNLRIWRDRAREFEVEAHELFGSREDSYGARAFHATEALKRVSTLSVKQADELRQAIRCVEAGLNRACFVMAWAAVADLLLTLAVKESASVLSKRPRWTYTDKQSLAESYGDYAIIEALKAAEIIPKSEMKSLHGLLHRRNQCAHPSGYLPSSNEALGYVDESMTAAENLAGRI